MPPNNGECRAYRPNGSHPLLRALNEMLPYFLCLSSLGIELDRRDSHKNVLSDLLRGIFYLEADMFTHVK